MNRCVVMLAAAGVFALSHAAVGAQKVKGTLAIATVDLGWPESAIVSGGPYAGVIAGRFDASAAGSICFAAATFDVPVTPGDPSAPPPSGCGTEVGIGVHPFNGLDVDEAGARQSTIRWKDDENGYEYMLIFGDAYANPPNYAHLTCLAVAAGSCISVDVDSTEGSFLSQSGVWRDTGPLARLTVRVANGARGVKTVGIYSVPFRITIAPQ